MKKRSTPARLDEIDEIQAAWRREAPSLDTTPIGILGRIYRIAQLASGPIGEVFEAHGLERGEFDVIATLYRAGEPNELTPTDLYRQLLITSGGLTHRLRCLEEKGLIRRIRSEEDGRSFKVQLTRRGKERALAAYRADLEAEARLLQGLDVEDRAKLTSLLRALHLRVVENR